MQWFRELQDCVVATRSRGCEHWTADRTAEPAQVPPPIERSDLRRSVSAASASCRARSRQPSRPKPIRVSRLPSTPMGSGRVRSGQASSSRRSTTTGPRRDLARARDTDARAAKPRHRLHSHHARPVDGEPVERERLLRRRVGELLRARAGDLKAKAKISVSAWNQESPQYLLGGDTDTHTFNVKLRCKRAVRLPPGQDGEAVPLT